MEFWSSILQLLLLLICSQSIISIIKYKLTVSKRFPPGPIPLPIIGNLTSLGAKPHKSLTQLAKRYGSVITLHLGYQRIIVVSSISSAKQLLQKNDVYFSNRYIPEATNVHKHPDSSVALLPPLAKWRNLRKICTAQVFANSRLDSTRHLRRDKVQQLLSYVQACSKNGTSVNIGQATFNVSLNFLSNTFFSMDLADHGSKFSCEIKEHLQGFAELVLKPNLAEFFPFLKSVDPQRIRHRSQMLFKKIFNVFVSLIEERSQRRNTMGIVQESDVLDALINISHDENNEFQPSDIPHLLSDLFIAGTETTSITIEWAMAELLHNPKTLKKAQKELDEVIGKGNPFEETDAARLPYLQAIIKETLRLHPAVPLLLPRKVDNDVELSGFVVPRNSQVWVNVWAIGRDDDIWEDSNLFKPERFLGSHIDFKGQDFELIPFGAGRRICLGMPLADRLLHWVLGSLIHSFDWVLEDGVTPENMDMDEKFGITLHKARYLCAIPVQRGDH